MEGSRQPYPGPYLTFLALYNDGEFFESHEVLEDAWHAYKSDFYHGLIILSAAYVKRDRGNPRGVRNNMRKARAYLVNFQPHYLGLDVAALIQHIDRCIDLVRGENPPEDDELRGRVRDYPLQPQDRLLRGDEPELHQPEPEGEVLP